MDSKTRFLSACRCLEVDRPPVWFMRQAGRYLPEYRKARAEHDFLETCHTPELAADVTMMPLKRYPLDAGIIFSDILVIPEAMGLKLDYPEGGPRLDPVVVSARDVDSLMPVNAAEKLSYVGEAIRLTKERVGPDFPVIGFSGAPFTVACYMTSRPGKDRTRSLRILLKRDPGLFDALMEKLTEMIADYLLLQIQAGADAVQLFDTWAGELTPRDYEAHVLPWQSKIMDRVSGGVPRILFVNGVANVLEIMADSGAEVLGIDWRCDMKEARRRLGPKIALQGNLDPLTLFAPPQRIAAEVRRIHADLEGPGHIFNLGHGILPDTPVEGAGAFVQAVLEL